MSWFGDGSFKQDLLNEIEILIETHDMQTIKTLIFLF